MPDKQINVESSLHTTFAISNDGLFSIHNLEYQTHIHQLQSKDSNLNIQMGSNIFLIRTSNIIPELHANKKSSITSPIPIHFREYEIARAEIEFKIKYKTFAWPFWINDSFYFVAIKDNQGQWQWVPKDISEIKVK